MRLRHIGLLFLFLALPASNLAQDRESDRNQTEADRARGNDSSPADKDDNEDRETTPDSSQSFQPSEEISEDLSVSFPADI